MYNAERQASGAADSGSDAGAEAIGGRLQANVRPRSASAVVSPQPHATL
jgi:hypothetical protein